MPNVVQFAAVASEFCFTDEERSRCCMTWLTSVEIQVAILE